MKIIAQNKKARFAYEILEKFEAGLSLLGSEIKSIRAGKISLSDSYAKILNDELWLINTYIAPYEKDTRLRPSNFGGQALPLVDTRRRRKLLIKKEELRRLIGKTQKGFSLIPLKVYLKHGFAKVEIAIARGKKIYDKRRAIKERDERRQTARELKY
jgi:SsrA-binding protein